jgi:hypothetical protein
MSKRRTKTDQRKIKAEIRARLANGMTDEEIIEEVGVAPNIYVGYKKQVLQDELNEAICESAGDTWARYSLLMSGCIQDLNTVIRQGHEVYHDKGDTRSMNAVVGAIKAKAQILEGIIDRGQNLGVIHKEPDRSITVGGISVAHGDSDRMVALIEERKKLLAELMGSYEATPYAQTSLTVEDIYGPPVDQGDEE